MMPVADRILVQCEQAIAGGHTDDARKLAHSLGVMTGNPAWERAYAFMLDGGNPMDHVAVRGGIDFPDTLAPFLNLLHDEKGCEFPNQSVRGGTQVNLTGIRTETDEFHFFRDLVGDDCDPIGVWSTRLQKNGYHIPHIHPRGGQSHVLYIDIPDRENGGYLYFGVSRYAKPPETFKHFVVPGNGIMVSFPNWLWHGVTPYMGDKPRLTIAWDTESSE